MDEDAVRPSANGSRLLRRLSVSGNQPDMMRHAFEAPSSNYHANRTSGRKIEVSDRFMLRRPDRPIGIELDARP
jgi:hypothetical protein